MWPFLSLLLVCCGLWRIGAAQMYELPDCFELEDDRCPNKNITFWLYTDAGSQGRRLYVNKLSLSDFYPPRPTKVLIHGFEGHRDFTPNSQIRRTLLQTHWVNVISVDYAPLAPTPCFTQAAHNAPFVSRCLAQLLASLLQMRLVRDEDLHLIGFGMGAHIAGMVSNYLPRNLRLAHITGLDPAKGLFLGTKPSEHLDAHDADFVDVIHTDGLMNGILQSVGHVDFYPNMGVTQPSCGPTNDIETNVCQHTRSAVYYAESITSGRGFWAIGCQDIQDFISGSCKPSNDIELMGYYARSKAHGNYFLGTRTSSPFAVGYDFSNLNRNLRNKSFLNDELLVKLHNLRPQLKTLLRTL
ncbi:inactive pancreatic lipase-related protein 1 [Scaptodrosophila lebanonensis]|uniref:Inactive pancreatic lipase-related protein 1 n=1 Tax=Drosophila lebanonensis TaxID=7225 RepID=A0A6J2U4M3_DROLE|nr:inactive pancreatic lipase-related protein 1 [Scaptodrosophila lebanonensis]